MFLCILDRISGICCIIERLNCCKFDKCVLGWKLQRAALGCSGVRARMSTQAHHQPASAAQCATSTASSRSRAFITATKNPAAAVSGRHHPPQNAFAFATCCYPACPPAREAAALPRLRVRARRHMQPPHQQTAPSRSPHSTPPPSCDAARRCCNPGRSCLLLVKGSHTRQHLALEQLQGSTTTCAHKHTQTGRQAGRSAVRVLIVSY